MPLHFVTVVVRIVAIAVVPVIAVTGLAFASTTVEKAPAAAFMSASLIAAWFAGPFGGLVSAAIAAVDYPLLFPHYGGKILPGWAAFIVAEAVIGTMMGWAVNRLRAERSKARASEARYRHLVEDIPGVIWEFDSTSRQFTYSSPPLGVTAPRSAGGRFSASWDELQARHHPDDRDSVSAAFDQVMAKGAAVVEGRRIGPNGEWRRLRADMVVVRDAEGRPVGARGVTVDVTEEHAERSRLLVDSDRFRRLFERARLGLLVIDPELLVVTRANPAAAELFGAPSPDSLVGRDFVSLGILGQGTFDVSALRRIVADGTDVVLHQAELLTSPADRRFADVLATRNSEQETDPSVLVMLTDRTQEVLSRADRERAERRFRGIFESAAVGFTLSGLDGVILQANRAFADLLGETPASLIGRSVGLSTDTEAAAIEARLLEELRRGERASFHIEKRLLRSDGNEIQVRTTVSIIHSDDGTPPLVVSVVEDITDRRRLEETLLQRQRMEAIGMFAGGIAHDFNNLLAVILGESEFVLARASASDPLRAGLQQIVIATERAAELIRQLLVFSRRGPVSFETVSVNSIAAGVVTLLQRVIGEDIALDVELLADPDTVLADRSQLEQVLMNLAMNARDAMPGGGTLTLRSESRPGGRLEVTVADTGVGMDEATSARIFEPFFTTKGDAGGTGLGLATVYGILERLGGEIAVESTPGSGTTFTIALDFIDGPVSTHESRQSDQLVERGQGGECILVVEDDDAVRRMLEMMLSVAGYDVTSVAGPELALVVLEEMPRIDLLLTDVVMAGMNGRDLADRVLERRPGIRVLFVSGYTAGHFDKVDLGREVDLLEKPFTASKVTARIREILSRPG